MSSKSPISRFERFARDLVEGSVDRLLGQPSVLANLARELALAAESSQKNGLVADQYLVQLHPETLAELERQYVEVTAVLEEMLSRLAEQQNLVFAAELHVGLKADDNVSPNKSLVIARYSQLDEEPTAVLRRKSGTTAPLTMAEAYLIVNGRQHVALEKAINTIGRALDNDIILEDPGVSRTHAQIRWRNGRFEIFDVGSRAGTLVNGRAVTSVELRSGDVIKLGNAAVIYGEEEQVNRSVGSGRRPSIDITQEISSDDLL